MPSLTVLTHILSFFLLRRFGKRQDESWTRVYTAAHQIAVCLVEMFASGKLLAISGQPLDSSRGFSSHVDRHDIGLLMGRFRAVEHFLDLYVNSLCQHRPRFRAGAHHVARPGVPSRIAVCFFCRFVIIINTMTGVKQSQNLVEMARSFAPESGKFFSRLCCRPPAAIRPACARHGRAVKACHRRNVVNSDRHRRPDHAVRLVVATDSLFAVVLTFSLSR